MGRPLKLNKKMIKKVSDYILLGMSLKGVCRACGISFETYCVWRDKGRESVNNNTKNIYHDFHDAVEKAHGDLEAKLIAEWQGQMPKNWQAVATFMERRFPENWSRKERIELSGDKDNPVQVNVNDEDDLQRKILEAGPEAVREFKEFVRKLGLTGNEE